MGKTFSIFLSSPLCQEVVTPVFPPKTSYTIYPISGDCLVLLQANDGLRHDDMELKET